MSFVNHIQIYSQMEHEKYKVVVTDLRGEEPVRRTAVMIVIDDDMKWNIFWLWFLDELQDQLKNKRGTVADYKDGEYRVKHKKTKQLLYTIRVTGHTASTPSERKGQTRIVRGKINVKVL